MRKDNMTFTKHLFLSSTVFLAATLAGCGNAASTETPAEPASQSVQTQTAGNWDIISDASHIRFTALQEGDPFTGEFKEFTGIIDFDPDALEDSSVRIEIPLSGVDAGSNDRNSTLPGKVWFSTKAYPVAVFASDEITRTGDGYEAAGTLTVKGKALPVTLAFDLKIAGSRADMTGQATLDRTDWDVGAAPWNTDEWVSKDVNIDVKVVANRS